MALVPYSASFGTLGFSFHAFTWLKSSQDGASSLPHFLDKKINIDLF